MNGGAGPAGLEARLIAAGLGRGPVFAPSGGQAVRVWLRGGEPAIAVLVDGDPGDVAGLVRIAWSLGCTGAIVPGPSRDCLIETAGFPESLPRVRRRRIGPGDLDTAPDPVPGVVHALVRLAETWRVRLLRRSLVDHRDWTETALNLAVEAPIAAMLLNAPCAGTGISRMQNEIEAAGVELAAVPPGLLALAWDLHLSRGVRLDGADASVVQRPPGDRAGPDRAVLGRFAAWAGAGASGVQSVLVPACGAGRLLLGCAPWAAANNIQVYALDPDPRAVLFASALVDREYGARLRRAIETAHPLVGVDLDDDPLARLVPDGARARLRPADWTTLFDGVDRFDRVLIAGPGVPLSRRTAVQRYIERHFTTARAGTDPALLLVEAGARHLAEGGRLMALYRGAAYRSPSASALRQWLAQRVETLVGAGGHCAVGAAAVPLAAPILAGTFGEGGPALRPYPRSALDPRSWTITDPVRAAVLARLEADGAPLGEILVGGVRPSVIDPLDPALLIGASIRRRLLRADRRAANSIRPVITPDAVIPFGSARTSSLYVIAAPLPPRARRRAIELGLDPPASGSLPPPSGPRLLFAEGARAPAFLCDPVGRAIPAPGVGTIAPADLFLAGLLHAAPMAALIAERCPSGLSARCLSRLPVRLPDPYDEREGQIGAAIATLARRRMAITGLNGPGAEADRRRLEAAIDRAVERLYGFSSL